MNLRSYYPDFVAIDNKQTRWMLETKGAEDLEVSTRTGQRLSGAKTRLSLVGLNGNI